MAVTTVFAGAADGDIKSEGASYIAAVGGAGTFVAPAGAATELWEGQLFFADYECYLSYVDFSLAAITPGSVVSAAVMQTWLITDNSAVDFNCIALGFDWGTAVVGDNTDWLVPGEQTGTWWTTIPSAGIGATGAYKSWSSTTDITALLTALAGNEVNFCLSTDLMQAGITPVGAQYVVWSSTNVAGTTQDPKITITHTHTLAPPLESELGIVIGDDVATAGVFSSPNAPTAAVASDLVVEWDFDNDGDFSESVENITPYVLSLETFTGRDFPSGLTGETKPGQARLTLDNSDGRFSYYNTASPLATAPFSLRAGAKLRVRTATSVPNDPVLLARDRFDRADGALVAAETGQLWTAGPSGGFTIRGNVAAAINTYSFDNVALLDVGVTDHYVQGTIRQLPASNDARHVGFYARYDSDQNYTRVSYDTIQRRLEIHDMNAGAFFIVANSDPFEAWEGMTIGVAMVGSIAIGYVGGAEVCRTGTLTRVVLGTKVGLFAIYQNFTGRSPELDDFHVWDHVAPEVDGVLWTGDVGKVKQSSSIGALKTATLTADGVLVRAAAADIAAPRLPTGGAPTGLILGDVLRRAGALHPPQPLSPGAVTTGAIGIDDGKALDIARMLEDTEQGFIYETNEGQVSFLDSADRATASSAAWFSDTLGVGQYRYITADPQDDRGQLINRVTAGVSPKPPGGISYTQVSGGGHVDITLPTVAKDDLIVVFVANSQNGGQDWHTPIWWHNHRDLKGALGMRVYSHWCAAGDTGSVWRLRTWNGAEIGVWVAHIWRIQDWFKGNSAAVLNEVAKGFDPNAFDVPWGRAPTLFIACVTGIGGGAGGMGYAGALNPPDGYDWATGIGAIGVAPADAQDVGILTASKIDVTDAEDPTSFNALTNALISESALYCIRGYNGPHTKATLEDPNIIGGNGVFVTVDNEASQADYNAILPHRNPSNIFPDEATAEAYGTSVTDAYGRERPIIVLVFWATSSSALRSQAIARRVGDKVTLTANNMNKVTGTMLGIEQECFIEAIANEWSAASKLWRVTWHLSPAA